MTRRGFLKLLGLAPLVPIAAKIATAAPAPKFATAYETAHALAPNESGLTLAKLQEARRILDRNEIPACRTFVYDEQNIAVMRAIFPEWPPSEQLEMTEIVDGHQRWKRVS